MNSTVFASDRGGVPALDGIVTKPRAEEEIIPSPRASEEMKQGRRAEIEVGRMSGFSWTGAVVRDACGALAASSVDGFIDPSVHRHEILSAD
jgi:hypothetical protein